MRIPRRLAALFVAVLLSLTETAFAASFADLTNLVGEADWTRAEVMAKSLDEEAGQGDLFSAYVASARLVAEGNCESALPLLQVIRMTRPYFVAAHELSFECHRRAGDRPGALADLDAILAVLPEGPQRQLVERMRETEAAADGPSISFYGDMLPTTNVERQTAATDLNGYTITEESRGHPGVLLRSGVSVAQRIIEGKDFTLTGVGRADASLSTADYLLRPTFTLETPMTFGSLPNAKFLTTPFVAVGFAGTTYSHLSAGLSSAVSLNVTDALTLSVDASAKYLRYQLVTGRDGPEVQATVAVSYLPTDDVRLTTSASVDYTHTSDDTLRELEVSALARVDAIVAGGFVLGAQGEVGRRFHASPPPMSLGPNQTDTFVRARADIAHQNFVIGPFMPSLYYQFQTQWSDNVFYQFTSHDVGVTLRARIR